MNKTKVMTGIELIAKERKEQIEKHGRSLEADKHNNQSGELCHAAVILLGISTPEHIDHNAINNGLPGWYGNVWENMVNKIYKERLIIAGALIAAEIDRLNNE